VFSSEKEADINEYFDLDFSYVIESQKHGISNLKKLMIASSRGCPFNCAFCFKSINCNNRIRYVEGINVASFIKKFYTENNIRKYYFVDDTFGIDDAQLNHFAEGVSSIKDTLQWSCMSHANILTEIKLQQLKSLGCNAIHLGVESGSQRMLDSLNKSVRISTIEKCSEVIHENGIELRAFVLFGLPDETADDMEKTRQLIERISPDEVAAQVYIPYNGTLLFNKLLAEKKIGEIDWTKFNKSHIFYGTEQQSVCDDIAIREFFEFVDTWNTAAEQRKKGG
jgi:radical SAM superfamily enzyme YgiQ (UPF0313 family)